MPRPTLLAALVLFSCLSSCSLFSSARDLTLHLRGSESLHLNDEGEPTSVRVWVVLMTQTGPFETASFRDLSPDPKAVLGDQCMIVGDGTTLVKPGETKVVNVQVADVKSFPYIGIVARHREERGDDWRQVIEVARAGTDVGVAFDGYAIRVLPKWDGSGGGR